jgi:peptidoglycan/LPS O-acetylase OafA/YrhL
VMLFFLLSAFLMSVLYWDKEPTLENLLAFMRARFARVLPLYLLIVVVSFAFRWPYAVNDVGMFASHLFFLHGTSSLWTIPPEVQLCTIGACGLSAN